MMAYHELETPIGRLLVAGDEGGLRHICLPKERHPRSPQPSWKRDPSALQEELAQLRAYFAGELLEFDLALAPEGTEFQLRVWRTLAEIPYGETISYGELATRVGNPAACRAVGAANGRNPLPIVLPCHRVIGHNGKLVGFGGGLDVKAKLLEAERRVASNQHELFAAGGSALA